MADEVEEFETAVKFVFGVALLGLFRLGSAIDVVLIGTALGTLLDFQLAPRLLWGPESSIATNALLPMFIAVGFMLFLAVTDLTITTFLNDHVAHYVKWEVRPHVRRVLLLLLRLAYHGYLICAGAAIGLWTHLYLWHGHQGIWVFGLFGVLVANGVSESARIIFQADGKRKGHREQRKASWIEIGLIVAGIGLGIIGLVQHLNGGGHSGN